MTRKEIIQEIRARKWEKFLSRPYTPFFLSMHVNVYYRALKEVIGIRFKNFIYVNNGGIVDIYRDTPNVRRVEKRVVELLRKRGKKIRGLIKEARDAENEIKRIVRMARREKTTDLTAFERYFSYSSSVFVRLTTIPYYLGTAIEKSFYEKDVYYRRLMKTIERFRDANHYSAFERWVINPYVKQYARERNIAFEEAQLLLFSEIKTKKKIGKAELAKRKKHFIYVFFDGREALHSGQRLQTEVESIAAPLQAFSGDALKGTVAQRGVARGRVKIVNHREDVNKFRKGNILVSISTHPDLLPAMKRAGAIVTDEGGMISHAAIISRELGVPCIVGTKIATKFLKEGDRVEVDAEKGIVRKI
jgi:phosphohistidine swiveling domain-containing protein